MVLAGGVRWEGEEAAHADADHRWNPATKESAPQAAADDGV